VFIKYKVALTRIWL